MADPGSDAPPELLFKSNKRRKVIRKRHNADTEDLAEANPEGYEPSDMDLTSQIPAVRRPIARKHGIAFSNSAGVQPAQSVSAAETALVPVKTDESVPASIDRFTKPTGKTEVVEDKHLTAYIDSKLAELRSSTAPVSTTQEAFGDNAQQDHRDPDASESQDTARNTSVDDGPRTRQPRLNTRRAANRPPRRVRQKDPSELAREAMIEQILGESQVPMYDQTSSAPGPSAEDDGIDRDEAVAEAFKAEFLASLQERKRRRTAVEKSSASGKVTASVPSGPKLGGSRSQREKMRQLEEAKGASGGPSRR
ncbi:hypothetical protein CBER1_05532 [Cercospora berteroae]|uniref:Uncharacterized protein n=1 Tax=Cercospora berteroae TaxID=357750 RepID=A0A2S6BSV5_9PEZI|nr:hypothetical protein CBER1_05532 [Cercospora berteroae]